MMKINDLPNLLTKHDSLAIGLFIRTRDLCKRLYDNNGYTIYLDSYEPELNLLRCHHERVNLFADGLDDMISNDKFEIPLSLVEARHYLPSHKDTSYKEFKEKSVVVPYTKNECVNFDDSVVFQVYRSGFEIPHPLDTYVIYNEQVNYPILYVEGQEHPYSISVQGKIFRSDSLDVLYKLAYDQVEYKSVSLIEFEEYLDTDKAKLSMETAIKEAMTEQRRVSHFARSLRFTDLTLLCQNYLATNSNLSVTSDNCLDFGFNDKDEFYLYFDAAYGLNEGVEEKSAMFPTFISQVCGLCFTKIHGQGTCHIIALVKYN